MGNLINCGMVEIVRKYQEQNVSLKARIKELEKEIERLKGEKENDENGEH